MAGALASRGAARLAGRLTAMAVLYLFGGEAASAAEAPPDSPLRVKVFFRHDASGAPPQDCSAVAPVERTLPATRRVASAALQQLFLGPTAAEQAAGYHSFFSPATTTLLKGITIRRGTAYVNLADLREQLTDATSSCGAEEFHAQVSRTLFQFPSIRRVIYAFEGDPRRFYTWLGEPCDPANDHCDARPFRP